MKRTIVYTEITPMEIAGTALFHPDKYKGDTFALICDVKEYMRTLDEYALQFKVKIEIIEKEGKKECR